MNNRCRVLSTLKWIGTVTLIVGSAVNTAGVYPHGAVLLTAGGIPWFMAAVLTRDLPLMVTNAAMIMAAILGFMIRYQVIGVV